MKSKTRVIHAIVNGNLEGCSEQSRKKGSDDHLIKGPVPGHVSSRYLIEMNRILISNQPHYQYKFICTV